MKSKSKDQDLYFYKGKFLTELGLKRALIKEGRVWVSRGTFYLYEKTEEYYFEFDTLRDILSDKGVINEEEYNHFQKWINHKKKEGELKVLSDFTFYHLIIKSVCSLHIWSEPNHQKTKCERNK